MDPNREMREEVEAAVGHPVDQEAVDRTLAGESHSNAGTFISENKLLLGVTLAGAVVVGVILSLALDSVIFLVLAVLVHWLATTAVMVVTMRMTTEFDKPDPRAVARLEEEGVADPERALNDAVRNVGGDS
jgi:hypothetical protein